MLQYGVLRGRVDVFKREDDLSTPHLQIRVVDGHNQAWRVPVNVLSADQSHLVFHRADPLQNQSYHCRVATSRGWVYVATILRTFGSPLPWTTFGRRCSIGRTESPSRHTGPGADDDLQDMLVTYLTATA